MPTWWPIDELNLHVNNHGRTFLNFQLLLVSSKHGHNLQTITLLTNFPGKKKNLFALYKTTNLWILCALEFSDLSLQHLIHFQAKCFITTLETIHKHLLGAWSKRGALKVLAWGEDWKNDHKFSWENWVYMIFYGIDPQFSCHKSRALKLLRSERGAQKISTIIIIIIIFFHQALPYKCLWLNSSLLP